MDRPFVIRPLHAIYHRAPLQGSPSGVGMDPGIGLQQHGGHIQLQLQRNHVAEAVHGHISFFRGGLYRLTAAQQGIPPAPSGDAQGGFHATGPLDGEADVSVSRIPGLLAEGHGLIPDLPAGSAGHVLVDEDRVVVVGGQIFPDGEAMRRVTLGGQQEHSKTSTR